MNFSQGICIYMGGHVFIIRADLTRLFCDAWLMPTAYRLHVRDHWIKNIKGLKKGWQPSPPNEAWKSSETRVMEITDWPLKEPKPWLVNTGGGLSSSPDWYAKGVSEFFETVAPIVKSKASYVAGRTKPLLALPLVGTGAGGGVDRAGEILRSLLPVLYDAARSLDIDIALTTASGPAYAAAINARKILSRSGEKVWPESLSEEFRERAEVLARSALNGELVLFLGAGVSAGAGLPTWKELLESLAGKAGVFADCGMDDMKLRAAFANLNNMDQARLIADHFNRKDLHIGVEVADLLKEYHHCSLAHAILAAIQVKEVVTTNYDSLFEIASGNAQDTPLRVLPYDPAQSGTRWILKLHGCVTQPKDIVLTRSDYLRYDEKRAALKGIVQALLITRHMLFVGFSLTDDNFHRIIEDVRKAVRGDRTGESEQDKKDAPFGTALTPGSNLFIEQLWRGDLNWVRFQDGEDRRSSLRLQEIFLDYLASASNSSTAHLMDHRYDGVMTESEMSLRSALEKMISNLDDRAKQVPAWHEVQSLIQRFGGKC
jgi:hypothetical protein